MSLSILIPTTVRRVGYFCPNLINYLYSQIVEEGAQNKVEILWLGDNYGMTVGEKRNRLLDMAHNKFLAFIDDDDSVSADYISSILKTIDRNPSADAIVFDCITRDNGKNATLSKYSKRFAYKNTPNPDGIGKWFGLVAHTMVWRSSLAKKFQFPDESWEEDMDWVKRANKEIHNEVRIDKVLYYYRFNSNVSETRDGRNL